MRTLASFFLLLSLSFTASAESMCDVRIGHTLGMKVVEFASGNVVHSKMALRDMTPDALKEEMINLQDMGICESKIVARKCVLKFEKKQRVNLLSMFRGQDRWLSWNLKSKNTAQNFIKGLQKIGFCS